MTVKEKIQELHEKNINEFYIWHCDNEFWYENQYLDDSEFENDICDYFFIQVEILYSDNWGQYIPNQFYLDFKDNFEKWNLDINEYMELNDINNEFYWDTWDMLLNNAKWTKPDGIKWNLYQNGDLFAITYL